MSTPPSLSLLKHVDSTQKRSCYDDTILTKLSFNDENDPHSSANLRRVQTIRLPSSQRKTLRMSLPTFLQSSNDDDEVRIPLLIHRIFTPFIHHRLVHSFQLKTVWQQCISIVKQPLVKQSLYSSLNISSKISIAIHLPYTKSNIVMAIVSKWVTMIIHWSWES